MLEHPQGLGALVLPLKQTINEQVPPIAGEPVADQLTTNAALLVCSCEGSVK
jgi:hypothetical protein